MLDRLLRLTVNLLVSIDQLGNTLAGGDPDETISSRWGKWRSHSSLWRRVVSGVGCWLLDKVDAGHCQDAIEHDEGKDRTID